ncbi:MAG: hypothetical protein ACR2II_01915 [Chthoniobacterales bacterium]
MNWPKEILEAHFEFMEKVAQKLRKAGDSKTTSVPERSYLLVKAGIATEP